MYDSIFNYPFIKCSYLKFGILLWELVSLTIFFYISRGVGLSEDEQMSLTSEFVVLPFAVSYHCFLLLLNVSPVRISAQGWHRMNMTVKRLNSSGWITQQKCLIVSIVFAGVYAWKNLWTLPVKLISPLSSQGIVMYLMIFLYWKHALDLSYSRLLFFF